MLNIMFLMSSNNMHFYCQENKKCKGFSYIVHINTSSLCQDFSSYFCHQMLLLSSYTFYLCCVLLVLLILSIIITILQTFHCSVNIYHYHACLTFKLFSSHVINVFNCHFVFNCSSCQTASAIIDNSMCYLL